MKFPAASRTTSFRESANYIRPLSAGVLLVALLLVVSPGVSPAQEEDAVPERPSFEYQENRKQEFVPGRLLVKASEDLADLDDTNRRLRARTEEELPELDMEVVEFAPSRPVEEVAAAYERDPDVRYAEPDFVRHPMATMPKDPRFPDQWNLHNTGGPSGVDDADVDAPEAWDATRGVSPNVVAVVDTGVNVGHPDLEGNISTTPGWDFYHDDASVYDESDGDRHGTHVAGTIAATADNGRGVSGVAPGASILPLKVCGPAGCPSSALIDAFEYAASKGVKIVNASLGGVQFSQAERDAIEAARRDGVLFVFPAGNGGQDLIGDDNDGTPFYPASYDNDNIISVAASDARDEPADFSNYGEASVDLAAPGVDVLSTVPGSYETMSGTSMAAPHVSGVAALLRSHAPSITTGNVKDAILGSADKKPAFDKKTATGGRLNAAAALKDLPPASTNLTLGASRKLVGYRGEVRLTGKLRGPSGNVAGRRVEVWRSMNGGRNWEKNGQAGYVGAAGTYRASRRPVSNTVFQFRFAGDGFFEDAASRKVKVRARARLSRPIVPSKATRGKTFKVSGNLKPRHSGTTRLDFYQFRNGKWRLHKSVKARNTPYRGYSRYTRRYKLPRPGKWKVRARHADGNHAATKSRPRHFRVRR